MIRLMIVSHTFREKRFCKRWHMLSQMYDDVDITLLAPERWVWGADKSYTFGQAVEQEGIAWEDDRFRVRLIDMRQSRYFDWLSTGLFREIRRCKPDMIYYIGSHLQTPLVETIFAAKLFSPKSKIAAFSMRGLPNKSIGDTVNAKTRMLNRFNDFKWNVVKKNCDAIFCHYPDARQLFIAEGFSKPVYIQTQIGVDSEMYCYNEDARRAIREKYSISDEFVFGSATRFSADKGLFDILHALPREGNWRYLMLGSGTKAEEEAIQQEISKLGLREKVITPGFINWKEMPGYWSAMDCAIHVPCTTTKWVETFSLALVQAMSTGLPVIGSTSGSVPYQLGKEGIIVPEGDIDALRTQIIRLLNNPDEARAIGELMKERAVKCFDIRHLSHCFHSTMIDIVENRFRPEKIDMTSFNIEDTNYDKSTLA